MEMPVVWVASKIAWIWRNNTAPRFLRNALECLVAGIEDAGILGMNFLTNTNASIDITGHEMTVNGEMFYFTDRNSQSLNFRCFTRRSIVILPCTEEGSSWKTSMESFFAQAAPWHEDFRVFQNL